MILWAHQQTARDFYSTLRPIWPDLIGHRPVGLCLAAGPQAVMRFDTAGNVVSFMTCH